jgi:hypothetical protein
MMFGKAFVLTIAFSQLWLATFCDALFLDQRSAAKAQQAQSSARPVRSQGRPLWLSNQSRSKQEAQAQAAAQALAEAVAEQAKAQAQAEVSRNVSNEEWEEGVAVFIPGFGSVDREQTLLSNIAWLKQQSVPFECSIYVYKNETDLPLDSTRFAPCTLIRHSGMWMDHIKDFSLARTRKKWILHMLDSVQAQPDLKLDRFLHLMQVNHLGHATPTRQLNTFLKERPWRCGSHQISKEESRIGRFVSALELQLDVFSRGYFDCMQRLISPENPLGWGMDLVMPAVCGGVAEFAPYGRMGAFDHMTIKKASKGSYDKRLAETQMNKFLSKHTRKQWAPFCNNTGINMGELKDEPSAQ